MADIKASLVQVNDTLELNEFMETPSPGDGTLWKVYGILSDSWDTIRLLVRQGPEAKGSGQYRKENPLHAFAHLHNFPLPLDA